MKRRILEVEIESLGALGDGCGHEEGKPVYVPFTLEGDRVETEVIQENSKFIRARLRRVISPGESRGQAMCPHFSRCGGCQLQHLKEEDYYQFKRSLLENSVERAGFSAMYVEEPVQVGPFSRRRARFKVKVTRAGVRLGFYEVKSHNIVDLQECPALTRRISSLLVPLRRMIISLKSAKEVSEIQVVASEGKVQLLIYSSAKLIPFDRKVLEGFLASERLSSILWERNNVTIPVVAAEELSLLCGDTKVTLPPGAFIQATEAGQKAIAAIIVEETANATKVIDLYAGCGAYSFPLAEAGHIVKAVEGNGRMVQAIKDAITLNNFGDKMEAQVQDLYKNPVNGVELRGFDAIIVNPPRNGAEPQLEAIGKSEVPLVIIVSCNPVTLERDARVLQEHGYQIQRAVPVDQFYWTTHLESVVVFYRDEEEISFQ